MAQLAVEMTGDEAKLFRSLQKVDQQTSKVRKGFDKVARAGKAAGKTTEKAFGAQSVASLQKFGAALIAIQAGAAKVKALMQGIREEADKAGKSLILASGGRRALISIAGGRQERFNELTTISRKLRREQGLTPQQANNLTFQLASAGLEDKPNLFAGLADIGFEPTAGIASVQKLQSVFGKGGGAKGAGTAEQILNKLILAAEGSPVGPGQIATQATTAATSFANIGGSDEALLAMGAVMIKSFKSAEASFQRIKSLSSQIFKKGELIDFEEGKELKGIELIQNLSRLGREGRLQTESGEVVDVKKFLGEVNAIEALKSFEKREAEILGLRRTLIESEGTDADTLRRNLEIAGGDPILSKEKGLRRAQQRKLVGEEQDLGQLNIKAAALEERESAIAREQNKGRFAAEFFNFFGDLNRAAERTVVGDETFIQARQTNIPAGGFDFENFQGNNPNAFLRPDAAARADVREDRNTRKMVLAPIDVENAAESR